MIKKNLLLLVLFFTANINAQIITTVVGNGTAGYSGNGGPATAAGVYQVKLSTETTQNTKKLIVVK